MPNKQKAWNDLIKLADDDNSYVRHGVAFALVSGFPQVPDSNRHGMTYID